MCLKQNTVKMENVTEMYLLGDGHNFGHDFDTTLGYFWI